MAIVVSEELTPQPAGLRKIGFVAAAAFVAMALLSQPESRLVPLVAGAFIILLLVTGTLLARLQSRHGTAVLTANELRFGQRFEAVIDTEMQAAPRHPVRVTVYGYRPGRRAYGFGATDIVEPSRFGRGPRGGVQIPFAVELPVNDVALRATGVQVRARTRGWPLGWGATFFVE
jgi:hypothetical protein